MSGGKQYAQAPEVRAIAERLIELHHPHLTGVRIEYVWVNKPPVVGRKPAAAVMRKVSGLYAFLATPNAEGKPQPFFVMEVCLPVWLLKSDEWRIALVDHELKHGGRDEVKDTIFIVPHDLEEFDDVAARHGEWDESVVSFAEALRTGSEGGALALPLKNNRYQRRAISTRPERKSEWKAPQVAGAH